MKLFNILRILSLIGLLTITYGAFYVNRDREYNWTMYDPEGRIASEGKLWLDKDIRAERKFRWITKGIETPDNEWSKHQEILWALLIQNRSPKKWIGEFGLQKGNWWDLSGTPYNYKFHFTPGIADANVFGNCYETENGFEGIWMYAVFEGGYKGGDISIIRK